MNLKHSLNRLMMFIIAIPIIFMTVFWIERLLGYYPGGVFWQIAEIAAHEKNVDICNGIIMVPWIGFPIGPTTSEARISCMHEYASLAKDPAACAQLMPSEYGISCINDIVTQEYEEHPDSGFFPFTECRHKSKDPLQEDWCDFIRAHRSHSTADCEPIRNAVIRSSCIAKFKAWQEYPELRHSDYFGKSD